MITPEDAFRIIKEMPRSTEWFAQGRTTHPEKAYRFEVSGDLFRHISIDRRPLVDGGICVFVNALATDGTRLPTQSLERQGVDIRRYYERESGGKNDNPGISGSAARMPTLNPASNEVYRLGVPSQSALRGVLAWYWGTPQRNVGFNRLDDVLEEAIENTRSQGDVEEETVLQAVKTRRGQPAFRQALFQAYDGKCCVSRCCVEEVLEAAHIEPHSAATDYRVQNGLLLRADIHTLFDLRLIDIDSSYRISVASSLLGSEYETFHGRSIVLPKSESSWPFPAALAKRLAKTRQASSCE